MTLVQRFVEKVAVDETGCYVWRGAIGTQAVTLTPEQRGRRDP